MADSTERPTDQGPRQLSGAERLKQDFESRMAAKRPISHSVAVAYRQLIARTEQQQSGEHR